MTKDINAKSIPADASENRSTRAPGRHHGCRAAAPGRGYGVFRDSLPAVAIICLLSVAFAAFAEAPVVTPKQRVEREFKQLEMTLMRFMHNTVLPAPNIEAMNSALYKFMRENPGVVRILRTNTAGYTVCDVNSDSPTPEQPRNISSRRWLRYVTQNKAPYYNMDYDTASGITLFYAWPLMTGPDMARFSGAFAVMIDFTAHAALIDDAAPFQIAYRNKAFFQHEWEDGDFDEEPLEIKGTDGLSIRTELPIPTRLTQPPPRKRTTTAETEVTPEEYNTALESELLPNETAAAAKTKKAPTAIPVRTIIYIIVVIAALIFAYKFYMSRFGHSSAHYLTMEDVPTPPRTPTSRLTTAIPATPPPPQTTPPQMPTTSPPPIPPPPQAPQMASTPPAQNIDQQAMMSKMLGLIKQEFVMMDKKIAALTQRIERLEKRG